MKLIHRPVDLQADREYLLERHCRINYECDSPWAREMPYEKYRENWFSLKNQIEEFWSALKKSAQAYGTIAEITENENGEKAAYLWASYNRNEESGFSCVDVNDIYVEEPFRGQGIANALLDRAEKHAIELGATVIRSGTGICNAASIKMHEKSGFYQYRVEFEKKLPTSVSP